MEEKLEEKKTDLPENVPEAGQEGQPPVKKKWFGR